MNPHTITGADDARKKTEVAQKAIAARYEASVYTPSDACTVVLLDGLTKNEAVKPFAEAVQAADWTSRDHHALQVNFPGRIYVIDKNMKIDDSFGAIIVHVKRFNGIYNVYHLEGVA
jgi:hypothetical protein